MTSSHIDAAFKKSGGAYEPSAADTRIDRALLRCADRAQVLIDDMSARSVGDSLSNVAFGFITNSAVNAKATVFDGRPTVGLCVGAVVQLLIGYDELLSHPLVLPSIGEEPQGEAFAPFELNDKTFYHVLNDYVDWRRPVDPIRQAFSDHLLDLALDFLVGHELGHLAHGHCDLLNLQYGITEIEELQAAGSGHLSERDRQLFEVDADTIGAFTAIKSAMGGFGPSMTCSPHAQAWSRDPKVATEAFSYSVRGLCRWFGNVLPADLDKALAERYQPGRFRGRLAQVVASAFVGRAGWCRPEDFLQWSTQALIDSETAFYRAAGGPTVGQWYAPAVGELFKDTITHLLADLPELHQRLEPYRRAEALGHEVAGWRLS